LLYISLVVLVVAVFPLLEAIVLIYERGCQKTVDAMLVLPPEAALEASKPVCKTSEPDGGIATTVPTPSAM
jgi:hypothetical protein